MFDLLFLALGLVVGWFTSDLPPVTFVKAKLKTLFSNIFMKNTDA